ncbi:MULTISPECIES: FtsW/RodA/SpoVE family cell cycle protein [Gordonia]|uniref:FtsW/RodA/SpoVE family cell cycle protein n=1 Tax=Gordonia TaxID=2053 RepID=UPI000464A250|nr:MULTISPECIES: FtsW/RodA/SpoVE family cell cycle protein [Gordonia]KAF0971230.1 putative FtsW-like protein [Gordonia sp. YY1]MCR8899426.1 FtsW/RodA/SpoVE family cell cycle protein [Gordonia sp. GONU]MCZ0910879.1 FtsW/RodA/SpoVE family cell cycle protein [Gordonia amicalis]MCZ4651075.1 FtsW/RodA/SpoVE family cell cycle protein [Gordonia amicalis]UPW12532.1 FtsW/RodA/SpoVE family cell cycle protein [Gordonia amicalis]
MTQAAPTPHAPPREPATSTGRNAELLLLVFAIGLVTVALLVVQAAQGQNLTWDIVKYVAAYTALFGIAHLVVRRYAPHADPILLPVVAVLNGLGLVLIHRLDLGSGNTGESINPTESTNNADQQLLWAGLGIIAFSAVLILIRDHRTLSRYAYTLGLGGLIFLIIPAILPSAFSEINGSKNWIITPFFSIQPSEFSKILIIIFAAAVLVSKRDLFITAGPHVLGVDLPRARDLGPLIAAWAIAIAVMVVQKDLGTSLLIFATILTMLYVATSRVEWLVLGIGLFAIGAVLAWSIFSHLQTRVSVWLNPFEDFDGSGYQIGQSLFGLATGGLFGTGLGSGRPNIVPFANTDFIISTIGEELGLAGLTAILLLYMVFIHRGLRTGIAVRDSFGKLLATGLAFTIAMQIFVVVGGVTKLIPLTGLTTPFLSYGGSSLLANYILVALLIRISNAAREPDPVKKRPAAKPVDALPTQVVKRR